MPREAPRSVPGTVGALRRAVGYRPQDGYELGRVRVAAAKPAVKRPRRGRSSRGLRRLQQALPLQGEPMSPVRTRPQASRRPSNRVLRAPRDAGLRAVPKTVTWNGGAQASLDEAQRALLKGSSAQLSDAQLRALSPWRQDAASWLPQEQEEAPPPPSSQPRPGRAARRPSGSEAPGERIYLATTPPPFVTLPITYSPYVRAPTPHAPFRPGARDGARSCHPRATLVATPGAGATHSLACMLAGWPACSGAR
eukprot:scaffold4287_cov285-Prasinococcus_capsulatus_cf.AAC.3